MWRGGDACIYVRGKVGAPGRAGSGEDGVSSVGPAEATSSRFHLPPSAGLPYPSPSPRLRQVAGTPACTARPGPVLHLWSGAQNSLSQGPQGPSPALEPSSCVDSCCLTVDTALSSGASIVICCNKKTYDYLCRLTSSPKIGPCL